MQKRVLTLFTALMCLFVFAGCSSSLNITEAEAKANIIKAMEKQSGLKEMDSTIKLKMKVPIDGITQNVNMNVKLQADFKSEKTAGFVMRGKFGYTGFNLDMSAAYKDGYVYMQAMGMKTKEKVPYKDIKDISSVLLQSNVKFTEDILSDIAAKKRGGNEQYSFTLNKEKGNEILKEILGSMNAVSQEEIDSEKISESLSVSGGGGEIVVNKEGYVTKYTLNLQVTDKSGEEEVTADMSFEIGYNNPGQEVKIDYPADLDSYHEGSDISLY